MKTWDVRLTSTPAPEGVDLEQFSDDLLSALEAHPRAAAAVLTTQLIDRTVSPHFDVEAADAAEAAAGAIAVLTDVGRDLDWCPDVAAVEASVVGEPVPA